MYNHKITILNYCREDIMNSNSAKNIEKSPFLGSKSKVKNDETITGFKSDKNKFCTKSYMFQDRSFVRSPSNSGCSS